MQWMTQTDEWRRIEDQRWNEVRAATQQARLLRRATADGAGWTERLTVLGRLFSKKPASAIETDPLAGVPASVEADSQGVVIEIERVRVGAGSEADELCLDCFEEAG